ncbi:hypothetical protein LARV_00961 [Longilinea arvoryzae]|uniref:Uncharacterized protein n=1 Tax=Longilinea arvoryzae TaxID=360412 RepID=A0A0S7BI27_9CHLR|nr:hypothetical protein [Longilinea arvoryzae]GAP13210.1 hypothetical protein LARV_00961 [Longilinea arvoryzae]
MNDFTWIINLGVILLAVGIFLCSFQALSTIVEVTTRLWKRMFISWATRRLTDLGIVKTEGDRRQKTLDGKRLAVLIAIPVLALAVRDLLLSPLMILFGLLVIAWMNFQSRQNERGRVNEDAELAALQMRSMLSVDRSLLNALNSIELPGGVLKRSIQQVVTRLQMHQPPDQAAQALKGLPGTVTARLAALIANSARITDEIQSSLLIALEQEAHRQKLLRSKMRQTLALVRGIIRLLQGAVAAALVFVLLSPTWRSFFLQDIPHRTLLTVLMICSVLASLYFEFEVYQLGSGEAF